LDIPELNADRLAHYVERGRAIFELTDLTDAQVAVLPFDWRSIEEGSLIGGDSSTGGSNPSHAIRLAEDMTAIAANEGKPMCVFFSHSNATRQVPLGNSFIFRRSMLRSRQRPNEFALPLWVSDDIEASFDGDLPLRTKSGHPTISFMGYDPYALLARAEKPKDRPWSIACLFKVRSMALDLLSRSTALRCEFVIRQEWWNGAVKETIVDADLVQRSHREFVANMINSDYVLCARGEGNCSYRLYETLCCGRIPIFINTDCVLPYEQWIDWKQYCVWIEERDLPRIADIVVDFHERLSPRSFQTLQKACRQLWLDWLSPQGFFSNFHRHFP
jgi:hypothetical protein